MQTVLIKVIFFYNENEYHQVPRANISESSKRKLPKFLLWIIVSFVADSEIANCGFKKK